MYLNVIHIYIKAVFKNIITLGYSLLAKVIHSSKERKGDFLLRYVCIVLFFCFLSLSANAQTVLISPTGDGGFETGSTLSANGWTEVNDATNYWTAGTTTPYAGSRAAYISTDGTNNSYSNAVVSTSHFYRDITVPGTETNISLSFYLKGVGEANWDRLLVYTAPTSVTPVAGTPSSQGTTLTGANLVYTQTTTYAAYTLQTVTLPASLAGTTFRLIFTWQNDGNTGTNPPAEVDNISLVSSSPTLYYSRTSATPTNLNNWRTNPNGTGTAPPDFNSGLFIVQSGHSMTTNANWTVGGSVQVNNGGTLSLAGNTISIAGNTTVNGNLNITSATGTKTFTGAVTVNSGGVWNNTAANEAVTLRGGLSNYGTFNAGTGVYTFDTNSQELNGVLAIPRVTVNGVTLTNNNTLTVSTALSGTGTLTQAANAILNIGGTSAITTLIATGTDNTVSFTGANQTVNNGNYENLVLSGSGTKTLQNLTYTVYKDLTLSGTATTATVVGFAVGGNLNIGNGTTFTAAGFDLTVTGTTTIGGGTSGSLTISSATGVKTFVGLVTINAGANFTNTAANEAVTFRGGITNAGTFSAGTGIYTFDTNDQALTGTFAIPNVTVTGVNLTNNNTLTVSTALSGTAGTLTQAANATLNIGGTSGITNLTATNTGNTVNYSGAAQTVKTTLYYNLSLSGSNTKTFGSNTTIANNISIATGVQANLGAGLLHTANTLYLNGVAQTANTFGGTGSGAGVVNTTYFTATTGILNTLNNFWTGATDTNWHITTNWSKGAIPTASVPVIIPNVTNKPVISSSAVCSALTINIGSSVTLNGSNTLTISGNLSNAGTLTCNSGVISLTGTFTNTGTVNVNTGTVNYSGAAQAVLGINYYNLTLSGSGTKTLTTSTTALGGSLTFAGTATATGVIGLTIDGDVVLGNGTTFTAGAFTHNVAGNWTNNGGTFTPGTGTVNFTDNSASVNGTAASQTFNNITINKASGQALSFGGSTTALNVGGTFTQTTGNFNAPATMTVTGVFTLDGGNYNAGANLNLSNNYVKNTTNFVAGSGTVSMLGTTSRSIGGTGETTFNNLIINNSGGVALANNQTVNGTLTLTSGRFTIGAYNLTLGSSANFAGTVNVTNMIVASGAGTIRKVFASVGSITFPIGDNTAPDYEYSPFTVNVTSGSFAVGAMVAVNVTDARHPYDNSPSNYITRYWTVSQTGITNLNASITGSFVAADVVGSTANIISSRYISPLWVEQNVATATTISASNLLAFGDFSGRNNQKIIDANPATLTGFSYPAGFGPSSEQSFTVSGSALATNITVLPSNDYEISTGSGSSFVPAPIITLNVLNREVSLSTIYVRLKAGLTVASYNNEKIYCSSTGAQSDSVVCSGSVLNTPTITPAANLTQFSYTMLSGPSSAQQFTVSGAYLTGNITVTAPADYEVALSPFSTYTASVSIPFGTGTVNSVPVSVRLRAGLNAATYNEDITLSSQNAVTQTVSLNGVVNRATVNVSKFNLAGFIYTENAGPSDVQSFTVSGSTLSAALIVTPPTSNNFQISLSPSSGFGTTAISLTPTNGTVSTTTIYVRMASGIAAGTVAAQNIVVTSTGAISQNVICSGQVVTQPATISSVGALNGFFYIYGQGPSVSQIFYVSATGLSSPVIVTAPQDYEISRSGTNGTFKTNGDTVQIPNSSGKVNAVPVYVRLKSGLTVQTYNGQNITLTATNATLVNVVCNGKVVVAPTINAGPDNLNPSCPSVNSVTLTAETTGVTNLTWTGPNNFYSTETNPSLGVITSANNGTYVVTGNALSGVNLLTNGNFQLGNTGDLGFGSTYIHQQVAPAAKGNYWVCVNPQDVYGGFCNCPDKTSPDNYQMVVDGGTSTGMIVWSQTVSVAPQTDFQFRYWVQTVFNHANLAKLQLYINNSPIGSVNTAPVYGQPWKEFIYNSNSANNTQLQLTLINTSLEPDGNDFALDSMVFEQVIKVKDSVIINVIPNLAPSLAVTASENPVFTGTIVTFTATPTNGGVNPDYQWYVDGAAKPGKTGVTFDYTPTNGQTISCIMTSKYPCASPQTATAQVVMQVNPRTNYWYGGVDTDWGKPQNWTGGFVPAAGDDVEYATMENYTDSAKRDLQLDINRTIGNLINATGKKLIIPAGKGLIVNNSITTDGSVNRILIKSSSTLPNGSLIYNNPEGFPVKATVEMYTKAFIDNTQTTNNGKFKWQYFGIPITSVRAEPTFYGSYVRKWYEPGDTINTHWISLTNESILVPFYGYEICQAAPKTIVYQGQLINQNFNSGPLVISTTSMLTSRGNFVFANSYTSAIDIRQLEFGQQTEATIYLYNAGSFNDWLNTGGASSPGENPGQYVSIPKIYAGQFQFPRQIPSMSAMVVKALTNDANAYFKINYKNVALTNTDMHRVRSSEESDRSAIIIDVKGETLSDRMWLITDSLSTNTFDNGYDGMKMLGSSLAPQIFAEEADGNYQVNTVKNINNTTLCFQAGKDREYTMKFTNSYISKNYAGVFLVDLLENKTIDITESGTEYKFTANSTPDPVKRFKIVARYYDEEDFDKPSNLKVFSAGSMVFVQNFSDAEGTLRLYDMSGRFIKSIILPANGFISSISGLKSGAYVVNAYTVNEKCNKRVIVY